MRAREFINESTADQILYHGSTRPITKFRTPAHGVYFSPHEEWAEEYGPVITRARVWADPVYRIDYSHDIDDDIIDALFDRDYRTVGKFIKLLQAQGYRSMQSVTDSEMLVVFPGAKIEVLPPETVQESAANPNSAGCILRAADTGRWCLQKRSDHVSDPGIWGCWGGGRHSGESLEQTVRRELAEEGGYRGPIQLIAAPSISSPTYAAFVGIVPKEFEPRCNDEVADWQWFDAGNPPTPLHPSLKNAAPLTEQNFTDYMGGQANGMNVDEMSLSKYQPVGDFDKPGPFRGADKKLVPHPTNQLKTQKFFEKTPYDFRLFFSNISGTGRYSEYGVMGPNNIRNIFPKKAADQIIEGSEGAITVVFVGNKGDSKKIMTPWIMAHRIGHAAQASARMAGKGAWREAENHFFRGINQLLADYYGVKAKNMYDTQVNWQLRQQYTALFNAIGTQRSSRTGQIKRPYEFLYELFAQYLGTGQVTLNPLPRQQDYGRKAWGRGTRSLRMQGDAGKEAGYTTEVLAYDMELMFNDVLSSLVGKILVM